MDQQCRAVNWAGHLKDRYVKPFADAAFRTGVGNIVGPVRTNSAGTLLK